MLTMQDLNKATLMEGVIPVLKEGNSSDLVSLNVPITNGGNLGLNEDSDGLDLDQGEDRKRKRAGVEFIGPILNSSAMEFSTPIGSDSTCVDSGLATASEVQQKN